MNRFIHIGLGDLNIDYFYIIIFFRNVECIAFVFVIIKTEGDQ